jgi:excisionase family DNA binding protein
MQTSFLTSYNEQEFKDFLKSAIKEVLKEELQYLKPHQPETFSIKEAAEYLKLKIATLYEKTSRKLIPHFKKGNKLYFSRLELEEWVRTGKVQSQEEIEEAASTYLVLAKNTKRKK